jgi:hypothetical protein
MQTERRKTPTLTDEQIEEIAEKAAEKAMQKMRDDFYKGIGKGVINKLFVITGGLIVGAWAWAKAKGIIH